MLSYVTNLVAEILKTTPKKVGSDIPLGNLGMDSLTGMELSNRLEKNLGLELSANLMWRYPTAELLTQHLIEVLEKVTQVEPAPVKKNFLPKEEKSVVPAPQMEPNFLDEISTEELAELLSQELITLDEIL